VRAVNLLPKDDLAANSIRNEDPAVVVGSALGLIVLIALAGAFYMAHGQAGAQQRKLDAARLELGKLSLVKPPVVKVPKVTRPIVPIPAVTGEESARLTAVSSAMSTRIAWDRILREFALIVPDDVTVTALNMTAPSNLPVPAGTPASTTPDFNLQGTTFSHDSVARLLSRLMLMPDLTNVGLTSSSADLGTGQVTFTITATVKGAPPPVLPAPVAVDTSTESSS
jgi:Fimbrial assembly protein (PilN)